MSAPTLRSYQVEQLDAIVRELGAGNNRLLIKSPTGTGKTVTFAAMLQHPPIRDQLARWKKAGARMLVIAHREELLEQAAKKISQANPGIAVSIEQGDRYAHRYSQVVIASIQTLTARKCRRLRQLIDTHGWFPLVIVDEAHHAAAPSYRDALMHLGFLPPSGQHEEELEAADFEDVAEMEAALRGWDERAPKNRLLVGVTATPNRSDAIGLGCVFQTIAFSYALKDAIDDKHLVPIVPWVVETGTSLDEVRMQRGEFNQRELAIAVNHDKRNQLAVAAWREYADGLSTIAFTVDVAHAHDLAAEFQRAGVVAMPVSGETPKEERREILRAFTEREIQVITNCMVLTEGTDLPIAGAILHAKPTTSATLYEQMTGRGLRPYPGKEECIVIDLVDVARRHSLQAAPVLYGLPPGLLGKGKTLRKLSDEYEDFQTKNPSFDAGAALEHQVLTLEQLQAKATTFNVWTVPALSEELKRILTLNWISSGPDTYRLAYPWQDGQETLHVTRDLLGHFEVVATFRVTQGLPAGTVAATRQRTLASQVTQLPAALELAEGYVQKERASVLRLKDREATWRLRPASQKQLDTLAKFKVPVKGGLTMGAASDLLDIAFARRPRR